MPSNRVASEPPAESRCRHLIDLRRGLDEAARALDGHLARTGPMGAALQHACDDLVAETRSPLVAIVLADAKAGGRPSRQRS